MPVMTTKALRSPDSVALDRFLDPLIRRLTLAAAGALVEFRADRADLARIAEVAEKCNEGELTANERAEYEAYVRRRPGQRPPILGTPARQILEVLMDAATCPNRRN
jgi:hypothetical protein